MGKKKVELTEAEEVLDKSNLTEKNKIFCREYILDWNGARAYRTAYPDISEDNARIRASTLLTNVNIQEYIGLIKTDLEKLCGISKAKVVNEHIKLAFSSIAYLHDTWIKRKEFESLTDEQKDCIAEIDTKIKTEYEYNPESDEREPIRVEYVKIKLYDKQKALDSISKMMGFDAPSKTELTGKDGKDLNALVKIEIINSSEQVKDDSGS